MMIGEDLGITYRSYKGSGSGHVISYLHMTDWGNDMKGKR